MSPSFQKKGENPHSLPLIILLCKQLKSKILFGVAETDVADHIA